MGSQGLKLTGNSVDRIFFCLEFPSKSLSCRVNVNVLVSNHFAVSRDFFNSLVESVLDMTTLKKRRGKQRKERKGKNEKNEKGNKYKRGNRREARAL